MIAYNNESKSRSCRSSKEWIDPYKPFYLKGFCIYSLILGVVLLWPFDFGFIHKNKLHWAQNGQGVIFSAGQIISAAPCKPLFDKIQSGKGLSIELWVASNKENQSGPARIISYSVDPLQRNFMVGQEKDGLIVRLRTVYTDPNGVYPHAELPGVFASRDVQYIVVTYAFNGLKIFVNGQLRLNQPVPVGGFDNWDPSYPLVFGNEATGNRPWSGQIYYAAIYDRSITEREISGHYFSGLDFNTDGGLNRDKGLVAQYVFNASKERTIHDLSGSSDSVDLAIPTVVQVIDKPFLNRSITLTSIDMDFSKDVFLNVLAFIPIGFLLHGFLRTRFGLSMKISIVVLATGVVFTTSVESVQYFSATRNSSMLDVVNNCIGVFSGIAADRLLSAHLGKWFCKHIRTTP